MKKLVLIGLLAWVGGSRADKPAVHGMVVFGKQATYLSHLPMYHSPHDYQVILKVRLSGTTNTKAIKAYEVLKMGGELITFEPNPMDLTEVIDGKATHFQGVIYHGHFERGGLPLGEVSVDVEKVVFSQTLKPNEEEFSHDYVVFGASGEYFAAHVIKGSPSYDTIVGVSQPWKSWIKHCRTVECGGEITTPVDDSELPLTIAFIGGKLGIQNPPIGSVLTAFRTKASVTSHVYLETRDLQ